MRARPGLPGPPYPAPPLRHFPSVQTAFGDLENDLRSGAGTGVPRSPDGATPPTVHHISHDGCDMANADKVGQVKARQLSTAGR